MPSRYRSESGRSAHGTVGLRSPRADARRADLRARPAASRAVALSSRAKGGCEWAANRPHRRSTGSVALADVTETDPFSAADRADLAAAPTRNASGNSRAPRPGRPALRVHRMSARCSGTGRTRASRWRSLSRTGRSLRPPDTGVMGIVARAGHPRIEIRRALPNRRGSRPGCWPGSRQVPVAARRARPSLAPIGGPQQSITGKSG
jgi:hypothetical protein